MNLKNMRRLVRHLRSRKNPVGFNMRNWFYHNGRELEEPASICRAAEKHSCGTVACLAGHAALLAWQSGDVPKRPGKNVDNVATDWLGLNNSQSFNLFYGHWKGQDREGQLFDLTKAQAIAELNRLIEAEM